MNRINFIKPIRFLNTNEIRLWYWLCLIAGSALFCSITVISGMQWYLYRSLQKEKSELQKQLSSYAAIMADHQKQQEELKQLQQKIATINRYKTDPKNPLSTLKIMRNATVGMTLQTISISKNQFELTALCSSITQASACIKTLNNIGSFSPVALASLQRVQDKIEIIIKGVITSKLSTQ